MVVAGFAVGNPFSDLITRRLVEPGNWSVVALVDSSQLLETSTADWVVVVVAAAAANN